MPKIKNGFVTDANRKYMYGDEARVQCQRGYRLIGTNIVKCGAEELFDDVPTCEGKLHYIFLCLNKPIKSHINVF
jgi:Sushi repeat (SCR repeat)